MKPSLKDYMIAWMCPRVVLGGSMLVASLVAIWTPHVNDGIAMAVLGTGGTLVLSKTVDILKQKGGKDGK